MGNQSSSHENESSLNKDEEMLTGEDNSTKICKDGNIIVQEEHSASENETKEPSENKPEETHENENEENNGDENESEPPKAKKMKSFLEECTDFPLTNTANKQTSNLVEDANIMDVLTSPSTWRMIIKKISSFKSSFSLHERFIKLFVNLHDLSLIHI